MIKQKPKKPKQAKEEAASLSLCKATYNRKTTAKPTVKFAQQFHQHNAHMHTHIHMYVTLHKQKNDLYFKLRVTNFLKLMVIN